MNAQDVESIAVVIERALAGQRQTLEALIEQRRAECTNAQQASDLAREEVDAAEDRLRTFLERTTSDAILTMRHAAASDLARSQDLLSRRIQIAEGLSIEVEELRSQLAQLARRTGDIAREEITAAEDRLRESLQRATSDAVLGIRQAAAADLDRSHDLLSMPIQKAEDLSAEVHRLRAELECLSQSTSQQICAANDQLQGCLKEEISTAIHAVQNEAIAELALCQDSISRHIHISDDLSVEVQALRTGLEQVIQRADEVVSERLVAAEGRLRQAIQQDASGAVLAMQYNVEADIARCSAAQAERLQVVDSLAVDISALRAELERATQAIDEAVLQHVAATEDRLRDLLQRRTSDAVLAMQRAVAADLASSQDQLLRRLQIADHLTDELRDLHEQLGRAQPRSAFDIAKSAGFPGTEADWLASLKGEPGESPDAAAVVEALMRTHGETLAGEPGTAGSNGAGIDSPAWSPGIHREGVLVQAYMGQFYRALRDTTDEPYASRDWQRVGTMGLHLAKPYADGVTYALGDLVVRDYSTFLVDAHGELHLFAARGPVGEKGKDGKGRDGKDGRDGIAKDGRDGYGIEDMQLKGGAIALLARNSAGDMQDFAIDLVPLLETLGDAIEERLLRRLQEGDA